MLKFIKKLLHKPYHILIFCLAFLLITSVLDQTFMQIFEMNRDLSIVRNRIKSAKEKNKKIQESIKKTSDPNFIESEVREKLDFTNEGDLIFIFPDNL
ncbi:MAG: FtsB family cell division protein [Bdellovibrionales bacterium]